MKASEHSAKSHSHHQKASACSAHLHAVRSGAVRRLTLQLLLLLWLAPLQRLPLLCLVTIPAAAAASSTRAAAACRCCCWAVGLAAAAAPVPVSEEVPELLAIPQLLLQLPFVCQREHIVPASSVQHSRAVVGKLCVALGCIGIIPCDAFPAC